MNEEISVYSLFEKMLGFLSFSMIFICLVYKKILMSLKTLLVKAYILTCVKFKKKSRSVVRTLESACGGVHRGV